MKTIGKLALAFLALWVCFLGVELLIARKSRRMKEGSDEGFIPDQVYFNDEELGLIPTLHPTEGLYG